jgi:methylamine dehydrogenase accessory protein MauD
MDGIWMISHFSLWLIVILLFLAVCVLVRQIGLIHRRLGPAQARVENAGLQIGELAPELEAISWDGKEVSLGSKRRKPSLIVFITPTCTSCNELAPAIRSVWKSERKTLEVIIVSVGGSESASRDYIKRHKLHDIPFIISDDVSKKYNVTSPPYALLIDERSFVLTKGVINHLEHLESLLNVIDLRDSTVHPYSRERLQANNAKLIVPETGT